GGLNRGTDFLEMFPTVKDRVKAIVCYGQTKEILYELGIKAGLSKLRQVDNVNEAVEVAQSFAESGDIVLLSPACASWDMYPSFEVRGRMFKESVHNL
ncbi:MAG: UDP-N-acetylmuramoyl-L-alanine--D-glutamate ligase, partial [Bacilli bacterium]